MFWLKFCTHIQKLEATIRGKIGGVMQYLAPLSKYFFETRASLTRLQTVFSLVFLCIIESYCFGKYLRIMEYFEKI